MLVLSCVNGNLLLLAELKYLTGYTALHLAVKLIGKLQDGTVFLKKGHDSEDDLFEFKTDEGKR